MRLIAKYGRTAGSASQNSNPLGAYGSALSRLMPPRWGYTAALAVGLVALFVSPSGRDTEDLVQLERLVPKIERAQTLSPEARETIERLIARQNLAASSNEQMHQVRRKMAIERVTSAMNAKDIISTGSNVAAR